MPRTAPPTLPFADKTRLEAAGASVPKPAEEMDRLHAEWRKEPTPERVAPLLDKLRPTIDASLQSFSGGDPERYRAQAELLTVHALETYDPRKGAKLTTHVHNSLQGLQRVRTERANLVHVPENVALERHALQREARAFESEYGREPSATELADRTGVSVRRQNKISAYRQEGAESQFLSERGDALYPAKRGDSQRIWVDYVYNELDPVDQKIFEWSTGYGGAERLPKKEIARRLKISAPAVSARITRIVGRLEEGADV